MTDCYEHADNCCLRWCGSCQAGAKTQPLERAVIKAAKDYMELLPDHPQGKWAYDGLEIAVDALLAAEKGEQ